MEPFGTGHTTQCIKNNKHIYAVPEKICAFRYVFGLLWDFLPI